MTITNKDLFYCYNSNLSNFLHSKGLKHLTFAINPNTNSPFYLYVNTDRLTEAIKEYKESKT